MPLPSEKRPWSFYRLGPTKEKVLFKRHRTTYQGVIVPAHIASYYAAFCAEFIGSLSKPYLIDPMTYIFANDPMQLRRFVKDKEKRRTARDRHGRKIKGGIKRSYLRLIEKYQGVVKLAVEQGRPLTPRDFADPDVINSFVNSVIAFQMNQLAAIPDKYQKYARYAERSGKSFKTSANLPMCLVAPYFPTRTLNGSGWHATNIQFVKRAKDIAKGLPVYSVILADTQILANEIDQIKADYLDAGVDGFLLWPDGFQGDQGLSELNKVFAVVKKLSAGDKPIILMYGNAFSMVLHYAGLSGFACGICYGEKKLSTDDVDMEGGIPPRYYISGLKKKFIIETVTRRIQISTYPDLVCGCSICKRKADPAMLDDAESREHFMLARAKELQDIRNGLSQGEFAKKLKDTFDQHKDDPLLQPILHLRNWQTILSE